MARHILHKSNGCLTVFNRLLHTTKRDVDFGIMFDIDGVLARGYVPIEAARPAFKLLQDEQGQLIVPTAFVTNALSLHEYKARQLTEWLHCKIDSSQMVMAHTPLSVITELHHKHCLFVGQGPLHEIAHELGFSSVSTVEDMANAYPVLDVGDHAKRDKVSQAVMNESDFPTIEAVIMLGEPRYWETPLQLIIDILLTGGSPSRVKTRASRQTLPVIACNLDLQYMHRAPYPRFGHGAFVLCLQSLYKKVTGHDLQYQLLVGKPSEVTFRYSEHVISHTAKTLGLSHNITRLYMIGDNLEVDIYGTNLYKEYIKSSPANRSTQRSLIEGASLLPQTVTSMTGVLVKTGVFNGTASSHHSHRDFSPSDCQLHADIVTENVQEAVLQILNKEGHSL